MTENEIEEVIEWCDMLIDRTFVVRDKFFNLPTGMVIPVNTIRTIRNINLEEHALGGKIVFVFDVIGMDEPLTSAAHIPKFPSYYDWAGLLAMPPMCIGMDTDETKSRMEEWEREQDANKKTAANDKAQYEKDVAVLRPIVEDALHDLKNHMVELWAPLYK